MSAPCCRWHGWPWSSASCSLRWTWQLRCGRGWLWASHTPCLPAPCTASSWRCCSARWRASTSSTSTRALWQEARQGVCSCVCVALHEGHTLWRAYLLCRLSFPPSNPLSAAGLAATKDGRRAPAASAPALGSLHVLPYLLPLLITRWTCMTNVLNGRAEEHVITIDEHQDSDAEAGSDADEAGEHNRHGRREANADAHTAEAATGTPATEQRATDEPHRVEH